jgi:hypothetical protein
MFRRNILPASLALKSKQSKGKKQTEGKNQSRALTSVWLSKGIFGVMSLKTQLFKVYLGNVSKNLLPTTKLTTIL